MAFNFVQGVDYKLSGSGITLSATSIILQAFKQPDGLTNLTMTDFGSIGEAVLEPGTSREENISFTGVTQNIDGTATLSGVVRGLKFVDPYDQDLNLRKSHAGGTILRISNTAPFYNAFAGRYNDDVITGIWTFTNPNVPRMDVSHTYIAGENLFLATKEYVDGVAVSGAPNMNTTTKGIAQEATQAEIDAGTEVGTTGAELAVNPFFLNTSIYKTQLPSSDEKAALAGTDGVPSGTNKYVTNSDSRLSSALITGEIRLWTTNTPPSTWLICDGAIVSQVLYANLFAVIGTTYNTGGEGAGNFRIPNLKGKVPVGRDATDANFDILNAPTSYVGEKTHTLTVPEMPAHTHNMHVAGGPAGLIELSANSVFSAGNPTSSTGGDGAHNNIQPYIVLNYIIKT